MSSLKLLRYGFSLLFADAWLWLCRDWEGHRLVCGFGIAEKPQPGQAAMKVQFPSRRWREDEEGEEDEEDEDEVKSETETETEIDEEVDEEYEDDEMHEKYMDEQDVKLMSDSEEGLVEAEVVDVD